MESIRLIGRSSKHRVLADKLSDHHRDPTPEISIVSSLPAVVDQKSWGTRWRWLYQAISSASYAYAACSEMMVQVLKSSGTARMLDERGNA